MLSPTPSPDPEPTPKTIAMATELHAPVAVSAARPPTVSSVSSPASTPATPMRKGSDAGIPHIGRRVPMYPNAGDVQAPTPSETPASGRKKHVYREEWEMNEGEYGFKRRETPYSSVPLLQPAA